MDLTWTWIGGMRCVSPTSRTALTPCSPTHHLHVPNTSPIGLSERNEGNVLIHGATMVLPNETGVGDLRIRNGVIEAIALGGTLEPMDDELLIDGTGLHLMPGMIDPQVHF